MNTFQPMNAGDIAQTSIIEPWSWYFGALKDPSKIGTPELPLHANEFHLGYYRTRRKDGPWEPVGIYPDEAGVTVGYRGDRRVDDLQELFLWVCRNPISFDAYRKAIDGGGFDDEPPAPAGIGHNSGDADPFEAISLELAGEKDTAAEFLKQPVTTQAEADKLGIWAKRVGEIGKRAEQQRVAEKEPHLAASRAVDSKWRPVLDDAKDFAARLKKHVEPFLIAEKRAEEERQRKAREEADRLRREADEAARKLEAAKIVTDGALATGDDLPDPAIETAARAAALRASDAAANASKEAEARKVNAGRTGARVSIRTEKIGVVTDYGKAADDLVAMNHKDLIAVIDQLANRAAKAGMPFDGMEIREEERAV